MYKFVYYLYIYVFVFFSASAMRRTYILTPGVLCVYSPAGLSLVCLTPIVSLRLIEGKEGLWLQWVGRGREIMIRP